GVGERPVRSRPPVRRAAGKVGALADQRLGPLRAVVLKGGEEPAAALLLLSGSHRLMIDPGAALDKQGTHLNSSLVLHTHAGQGVKKAGRASDRPFRERLRLLWGTRTGDTVSSPVYRFRSSASFVDGSRVVV